MLGRVASPLRTGVLRGIAIRGILQSPPSRRLLLASAASGLAFYLSTGTVFNDADSRDSEGTSALPVNTEQDAYGDRLSAVVWGSNKANIISPSSAENAFFKVPSNAEWLQDVALRDLVAHERHAACVDARGDVYQWGEGFFENSDTSGKAPVLSLRGKPGRTAKDITRIQLGASKIYALSASGRIYVLASHLRDQKRPLAELPSTSSSWWSAGWFRGAKQSADFAELAPNVPLSRGEKFVSIAAGNDHLLALTSKGRAFAHPITKKANAYGQLALRKVDVPDQSSAAEGRFEVELIPKAIADPFGQSNPRARQTAKSASDDDALGDVDDADIRFCDKLFEIPSLKGLNVAQIAAGARSSFARLQNGRALGWGANEFGQIGLGAQVRLSAITVPTEIILGNGRVSCQHVYAGGDLTCFVVEQKKNDQLTLTNVLFCGNGQWGGLGNNTFSNAQVDPIAAKNVSGLLEYDEQLKSLVPIRPCSVSISPVGHVVLTQETLACSGPDSGGRDLLVWGSNYEYQLGLGKRGSLATPTALQRPDGSRFMLMQKKAGVAKDLRGDVWKKGVEVEQQAVALYGSTIVYWRVR